MSQVGQRFLTPAARAVDLTKTYGTGDAAVRALDGVNVEFERGRFTAVMGPSGSGKSTLMHCMAGLDVRRRAARSSGTRRSDCSTTRDLTQMRRDRIGFVFQSFNLVPTLTAGENITLPPTSPGRRSTRRGSTISSTRSASPIGCRTVPASCPVASSSGSPAPAR